MSYIINSLANTSFISGNGEAASVDLNIFESALDDVHAVINLIVTDIPVDIFSILGMRNLSAFIGELFAISLIKKSNGCFITNPHQDGYPDLLLMNSYGKSLYQSLTNAGKLQDKSPFSPFPNGGLEIKATCGSVPTPSMCAKKELKSQTWEILEFKLCNDMTGKLIIGKPIILWVYHGIFILVYRI